MKEMTKTYGLPIAVFVLWGSLYVVSKPAMEAIPPVTLLTLRLLIAMLVIYIILRKKYCRPVNSDTRRKHAHIPRIKRKDLPRFACIGMTGYGAGLACLQISNDMLDASLSSLLNSICPIVIFALAAVMLHEKIGPAKIIGIILSIAGVYIILGVGGSGGAGAVGGAASPSGIIIACVSVFLWSLCAVLIRSVAGDYDPLCATFYGILFSMPLLIPWSLIELDNSKAAITLPVCLSVIYLGVVATALGNVMWNIALKNTPASTCSMFYPVQALTSAVMGIIFLGEQITAEFMIGAAIISAGIVIATASDNRKQPVHNSANDSLPIQY